MNDTYRIVVGIDGSEGSDRALEWAAHEAIRRIDAGQPTTLQALTAWDFEPQLEPESVAIRPDDPRTAAERVLEESVTRATKAHPTLVVAAEVVRGATADVLVRASDDADLLVLGSHGHSRMYHAVLGSVAEACIRMATCPVLVIPMARAASHQGEGKSVVSAGTAR